MSQHSLSLFEGESPPAIIPTAIKSKRDDARIEQQRHLLAARRLARRIARLPHHSPEQVHVGQMICRHLVAMLEEAQETSSPPH